MANYRYTLFHVLLLILALANCSKKARHEDELRAKAENGDAEAQTSLGVTFAGGHGVPKDEAEAVRWFLKAAEQGHGPAQFNLGIMYSHGSGVPKNGAEATKWYRKAAEQGIADAQHNLGIILANGEGVPKNEAEAVKWWLIAAEKGHAPSQYNLAISYAGGHGIPKNESESARWFRASAEQGHAESQNRIGDIEMYHPEDSDGLIKVKNPNEAREWYLKAAAQDHTGAQESLAHIYFHGIGVPKDEAESIKWRKKAAELGDAGAQYNLGIVYSNGEGVPKDDVEAYKWWLLASAQGNSFARKAANDLEADLSPAQRAEGQRLAREFKPRRAKNADTPMSVDGIAESQPESTGSGFFITNDGYLVTNHHVANEGATVRVLTGNGVIPAKVVKLDRANDLALLKAEGEFVSLAITPSRGVRLGSTVATVGFPNVGLQGFSPKLAKGEVASLAGIQDDARHFQISVPVQPGNSGGALVDERGNVIGVVAAKLSQKAAIDTTGTLAENVSYAVKSSYLLSFLESVPEVAAKLKEPNTTDRKFEDVIKDVEQAAVLVLVY